jgi:hypothetical protein
MHKISYYYFRAYPWGEILESVPPEPKQVLEPVDHEISKFVLRALGNSIK